VLWRLICTTQGVDPYFVMKEDRLMCTDETNELSTGGSSESIQPTSEPATDTSVPKPTLNRRRFLTAAALGTAAAALLNKGADGLLHIGPLTALANDLSGKPCTAQDVTVAPQAFVINEPCTCTPGGTFNAQVQFTVTNHTGTGRYCVTLHIPSGFGVPAQDVVLGDIASNTTQTMTGIVTGFPCNPSGGQVCIGAPGSDGRGKCPANTCLTVAWNTSPGATCPDTSPPGGQCRHQRICITGYGASLACVGNDCTTPGDCTAACGGSLHLLATVTGGVSPYFYTLSGSDGTSQRFPASGTTTDTSHCFTVTPTQPTTTYTLTVTDSQGCSRTATKEVTSSQLPAPDFTFTPPNCSGQTTLTATPSGLASYTWFDGATQIGTGNPLTATLGPGDHSITVTVTNSAGCSATSPAHIIHVNQPVSVSASAGTPSCSGQVTLTASASGGAGGFTFQWFDGGSSIGTSNPLTVTLAPGDHSITVTATDSAGCSATSAPITVHVNQPVSTSLNCGSAPDCTGHLSFTASATGGTGTYTFAWAIDGSPVGGVTGPTLAYTPNVDCNPHVVSVTATDSAGCVSGNTATRTVTQVVCTTVSGCP
jgi:hypothetical protein